FLYPDDEFLNPDDVILDGPDIHDPDDEFADVEDDFETGTASASIPTLVVSLTPRDPADEDDLHHSPRTRHSPTPRPRGPAFEGLETRHATTTARLLHRRWSDSPRSKDYRGEENAYPTNERITGFALNSQGHIRAIYRRRNGWETTTATEVAEKAKEACLKRRDRNVQTQEEADAEDEVAFLEEAQRTSDEEGGRKKTTKTGGKPKKKRSDKGKGKGKAVDTGADSDSASAPTARTARKKKSKKHSAGVCGVEVPLGSDFDVDSEGEGASSVGYTRGPIPAACKEEALQAREDYNERLEEIAKNYNRPMRSIQELVGEVTRVPRKKMMWNMYQQWYARHGSKSKPDGMTAGDWNKIVKAEFDASINEMAPEDRDDPEAIQTHFADIAEWHLKAMTTELTHLKTQGKLVLPVAKYIRTLTNLATKAFDDLGVHVFGFAIDDDGQASMMWGGSPQYGELRTRWDTSIMSQLKDYEAMFRTLRMEACGEEPRRAVAPKNGELRQRAGEREREYERRLFTEALRLDLQEASSIANSSSKPLKMEWDLSFLGWKHQVCLINWPTSMSAKKLQPCVGFKPNADALRTIIPLLKKRHLPQPEPEPDCDDEEDKEENEEWMAWVCTCEEDEKEADLAPRIESWTESEKELSVQEQGELRRRLQHVSDGKRYKTYLEGVKKKEAEGKEKGKGKGSRKRRRDSEGAPRNTVDEDSDADASTTVGAVIGHTATPAPACRHGTNASDADGTTDRDWAGPALDLSPKVQPPFNPFATVNRPKPRPLYAMKSTYEMGHAGGGAVASSSKVQLEDSSLGNRVAMWEESYERGNHEIQYTEELGGMEEPTPPAKRRRVQGDTDTRNEQAILPDSRKRKREEVELERERPKEVPTPELGGVVLRNPNGELRRSAPAGLPTVPVTDDMSPADVLRICWTLMPGNVCGGEWQDQPKFLRGTLEGKRSNRHSCGAG
ncbi:hypothetical protein B0H13DRAFT_1935763, partial [Mycena leptocephala]